MTNFILNGGSTDQFMEDERKAALLHDAKSLPINFTVLVIPFTKYKEFWEEDYVKTKVRFTKAFSKNRVEVKIARENRNEFLGLLKESSVVVIPGGGEPTFVEILSKIINIKKEFSLDNKIVYANSAGVNVLSTYYYSNSRQTLGEGLGVLPIKTICHYSEDRYERLQKLEHYKEKLPTLALRESSTVQLFY